METRTVLPLTRCPGCGVPLAGAAVHALDFGHKSVLWREAVADCFPVCGDYYIKIEDEGAWDICVRQALDWWAMNQELEQHQRGPGIQVFSLSESPTKPARPAPEAV